MSADSYFKSIIEAQGSLSLAHFMSIALSDSRHGYYTNNVPIGKDGDFITSPEISQMFGELVGIWCATMWQAMGEPEKIAVVEFGPGKGTLMKDFLRGTRNVKGFHKAVSVYLMEISNKLQKIQQEVLNGENVKVEWISDLSKIPEVPILFVANEFFDALPIHQFVKSDGEWLERLVTVEGGNLALVLSPTPTVKTSLIPKEYRDASDGSIYELCPAAIEITKDIAGHINKFGGTGIIIDYGYDKNPLQDSLQAVREHSYKDILDNPGKTDITSYVDFSAIRKTANDADINAFGLVEQGDFLSAMGMEIRTKLLLKSADDKQKKEILSAVERLVSSKQMGAMFKCMALTNKNLPIPLGF